MLGLTRIIPDSFSNLDSLLTLYTTPVGPNLECVSQVWNSTCTDDNKQGHIQRKFVDLCQNRFFTYDHVTYEDFLKFLKFHTLHGRKFFLMDYFIFLFIPVSNVAHLFWVILVFEFFLLILETLPCLLLLTQTLHPLDVFRLLTTCTETVTSLGWPSLF